MRYIAAIVLAICILTSFFAVHFGFVTQDIVTFYGDKMRGPLFSGFLSVGGFLFSVKTFIVIKLKEAVYDHEAYGRRLAKLRELKPSLRRYKPLRSMSDLLFFCVLVALVNAATNLTIGLIPSPYAVSFCMALAFAGLLSLILALLVLKRNMADYFDFIDENPGRPK